MVRVVGGVHRHPPHWALFRCSMSGKVQVHSCGLCFEGRWVYELIFICGVVRGPPTKRGASYTLGLVQMFNEWKSAGAQLPTVL